MSGKSVESIQAHLWTQRHSHSHTDCVYCANKRSNAQIVSVELQYTYRLATSGDARFPIPLAFRNARLQKWRRILWRSLTPSPSNKNVLIVAGNGAASWRSDG